MQKNFVGTQPNVDSVNNSLNSDNGRLKTFSHWPANYTLATPEQLARAGFFYGGDSDKVKCWYCTGSIQNWEQDNEPWTEHARRFPT